MYKFRVKMWLRGESKTVLECSYVWRRTTLRVGYWPTHNVGIGLKVSGNAVVSELQELDKQSL